MLGIENGKLFTWGLERELAAEQVAKGVSGEIVKEGNPNLNDCSNKTLVRKRSSHYQIWWPLDACGCLNNSR